MRPIALTGGIGAGKTTVARALRRRGAWVVSADDLAREVVEQGTPGYDAVVAAFGPDVVAADGGLDRAELARRIFADEGARDRLEQIVHPLVAAAAGRAFDDAPPGVPAIYEIPLLVEADRTSEWAAVIVVDASDEKRLARLVGRGMLPADARQRMAVQASRERRLAVADFVIDNEGPDRDLEAQVDRLWPELLALG